MGADANFWIRKRDLDIAHLLAKGKNETGYPHTFRVGFTKNSTKKIFDIAKVLFISSHYNLLYFVKPPVSKFTFNEFVNNGDPSQYLDREDVWTIDREYKSPTMIKNQNELPTKLVEKIIQYSSNTGDKIMDMFLGGFTTARVSIDIGREPLGFEFNKNSYNHFYPRFHLKR